MSWHYLKGNKAEYGPQHIICVDTETFRVSVDGRQTAYKEEFRLGVASYTRLHHGKRRGKGLFAFRHQRQFWAWLQTKTALRQVVWVFAHNLGFDSRTLNLWQLLENGTLKRSIPRRRSKEAKSGQRRSRLRTGLLVTADPPTIVEAWFASGGMVRFVDTFNYWQCSLGRIGKWVGLDKLPMPDPWEPDEAWLEYCRRDVEILEQAIVRYINWCRENQCGMFAMTLPSQAMHSYRHSQQCTRVCLHDEEGVRKLEGRAYLGGEVYVGYVGRVGHESNNLQLDWLKKRPDVTATKPGPIYQLDSNSLFPSVMARQLFPSKLVDWHIGQVGSRHLVGEMSDDCIAECLVIGTGDGIYSRRRGRSGRYVSSFVAVLCGPELARALRDGAVQAVRSYARYQLADLFSNWIETWWQRRWMAKLAGDHFAADMCKKIMNSLYGKFAQKAYSWVDEPDRVPPNRWGGWFEANARTSEVVNWRAIAGMAQRQQLVGYHPKSFPAISAFVTAYARERMRSLRLLAGDRNTYYQGIDSLYVNDAGLKLLQTAGEVDGGRLGALRIESSAATADFLGWGLYRIGDRWCRTSVSRGAVECLPGEFEQTNFERLESALLRSPEALVMVTKQRRCIQAANPVGIIGQDGWVSPLTARWGDNESETTDPRSFYSTHVGHIDNTPVEVATG